MDSFTSIRIFVPISRGFDSLLYKRYSVSAYIRKEGLMFILTKTVKLICSDAQPLNSA